MRAETNVAVKATGTTCLKAKTQILTRRMPVQRNHVILVEFKCTLIHLQKSIFFKKTMQSRHYITLHMLSKQSLFI